MLLPNGTRLTVLCGSGALAFNGLGWWWERVLVWLGLLDPREFEPVVIKTLTRYPRKGNLRWWWPLGCIKILRRDGQWIVVNAVGLTNRGIEWWIRYVYPKIARRNIQVIVSIHPESVREAIEMTRMLRRLDYVVAIELNVSCPNVGKDLSAIDQPIAIANAIRGAAPELPLIAKLSVAQPYVEITHRLVGLAEAVHVINTVPWSIVFPEDESPLAHLGGGGVSGHLIFRYLKRVLNDIRAKVPEMTVIAGGGIWTFRDMRDLWQEFQVETFSLGTLFIICPWRAAALARRWNRFRRMYDQEGACQRSL